MSAVIGGYACLPARSNLSWQFLVGSNNIILTTGQS
jgi:hypothetical protein